MVIISPVLAGVLLPISGQKPQLMLQSNHGRRTGSLPDRVCRPSVPNPSPASQKAAKADRADSGQPRRLRATGKPATRLQRCAVAKGELGEDRLWNADDLFLNRVLHQ